MVAAVPLGGPILHRQASTQAQALALAQSVADQLRQAIASQGHATLAVSGGRSPIVFFENLRREPLAWDKVQVVLVDERCVAPDHTDRNAHLVRQHLLQEAAASASFVDWLSGIDAPSAQTNEALLAHASSQAHVLRWPLDVAVMGMGEDGHTASWFPDSEGLGTALDSDLPLAWVRPRHADHLRLTLTLSVIQACRHVHLAIAGAAKQTVLAAALAHTSPDKPVQTLIERVPALEVWIAD